MDDDGDVDQNLGDPVAICAVSPDTVRPIVDKADWIGTDSYDPEGGTITSYNWTLTPPSGSSATMPGGSGPIRTNFTPDVAGTYIGELTVTTQDGRTSAPCEAELEAIPVEDLWIEMYWVESGDDMDLHLLRPGASSSSLGDYTSDDDCHYANRTPGPAALTGAPSATPSMTRRWTSTTSPDSGPRTPTSAAPRTGSSLCTSTTTRAVSTRPETP